MSRWASTLQSNLTPSMPRLLLVSKGKKPGSVHHQDLGLVKVQWHAKTPAPLLNLNEFTDYGPDSFRTVTPPHGDLVLSGVSILDSPNFDSLSEVWQQAHIRRQCAWYCFSCFSENCYFGVGKACLCGHLCVTSLLFCICSPNPWVLFSGVGSAADCHIQLIESHAGVFGGQALRWSQLLVIGVMMLECVCCARSIRIRIIVSSVSFHLLLSEFYIPSCSRCSSNGVRSIKV